MSYWIFDNIFNKRLQKDILLTLLFGFLSVIFRFISFNIPGTEGLQSDLRELPLIIGIIHLTNPLYSIALSAISSINLSFNSAQYIYTFLGHAIPLFILWYFFNFLKKQKINSLKNALVSLVLVLIYYLISILLIMLTPRGLFFSSLENNFILDYKNLFVGVRYEMIYTALAISFYYVQNRLRVELKNHEIDLERIINERTKHLNLVIKELKVTQDHLVQSEKMTSLGTLIAGVAHEINNPLNFISGGINIINDIKPEIKKNISGELNESFTLATGIINEGLNRSVNIVNALMSFSIKGESKLQNHDVHTIIDNTLLFMMPIIPQEIVIMKDYKLNESVSVYIEKMHQVFINILNNAIFVLKSDNVKVKKITIKTFKKKNNAIIEFINTGPEIPLKYLNQIFDPFFTTKDPDKGKGLGLSICYTYINDHKGKISATNIEDGVKFSIELPLNN